MRRKRGGQARRLGKTTRRDGGTAARIEQNAQENATRKTRRRSETNDKMPHETNKNNTGKQ